jgi:hypothetical protein
MTVKQTLSGFAIALLMSVAPVRAEFLQMDLSIFGMD